jgi:Colicin V production protein
VTGLDWLIIVLAIAMAFWGYQQGLIVGLLSLGGFAIGAFLGSRLGPALLPDGSHSPYAPATALAGALLVGGLVAVSLEGVAFTLRRRLLGPTRRRRGWAIAEASAGAALLVALALGLAWLFGAVALNVPDAKSLRKAVQQSAILRALNDAFPPSSSLINALHRIDPRVAVQGPSPDVGAPDSKIARDPDVRTAGRSVVRVLGTACGLGVEGSGWIAAPGLVVTNAHVVAGETDTTVTPNGSSSSLEATAVHYDPSNDLDRSGDHPGLLRERADHAPAHLAAGRRAQRQLRWSPGRCRRQSHGHGVCGNDRGQAGRLRGAQRRRRRRPGRCERAGERRPLHALMRAAPRSMLVCRSLTIGKL